MDNVLSVRDLSITVNHHSIVENVSFDIAKGDVTLLSGENGAGKSTILKAIMRLEAEGKKVTGSIVSSSFGDVLTLSASDIQRFRASVAYIQQRDEYSEMGSICVADIISGSAEAYSGHSLSHAIVNELIDEWIPRKSNNKRIFDAKSKPAKFSGGEQRLLSVLSIVATRPDAKLMIIDEPLNNLDYENARTISNMLNRTIKANPDIGLIMVSHCRIFPFITREIELTSRGIIDLPNHYVCHSCFGNHDDQGYYR